MGHGGLFDSTRISDDFIPAQSAGISLPEELARVTSGNHQPDTSYFFFVESLAHPFRTRSREIDSLWASSFRSLLLRVRVNNPEIRITVHVESCFSGVLGVITWDLPGVQVFSATSAFEIGNVYSAPAESEERGQTQYLDQIYKYFDAGVDAKSFANAHVTSFEAIRLLNTSLTADLGSSVSVPRSGTQNFLLGWCLNQDKRISLDPSLWHQHSTVSDFASNSSPSSMSFPPDFSQSIANEQAQLRDFQKDLLKLQSAVVCSEEASPRVRHFNQTLKQVQSELSSKALEFLSDQTDSLRPSDSSQVYKNQLKLVQRQWIFLRQNLPVDHRLYSQASTEKERISSEAVPSIVEIKKSLHARLQGIAELGLEPMQSNSRHHAKFMTIGTELALLAEKLNGFDEIAANRLLADCRQSRSMDRNPQFPLFKGSGLSIQASAFLDHMNFELNIQESLFKCLLLKADSDPLAAFTAALKLNFHSPICETLANRVSAYEYELQCSDRFLNRASEWDFNRFSELLEMSKGTF